MPKVVLAKTPAARTETSHSDIFMSIKPEYISSIASRHKNHEYRNYRLPSSVRRIWFYTSAPISSLHYIARVSSAKTPGQVPEDGGLGNEDFNAGTMGYSFGYEILALWKLEQPVSLQQAKARGYLKGPPQKYCWVPQTVIGAFPLEKQHSVFATGAEEAPAEKRENTISGFLVNVGSNG
ncbi:hypothetical protein FGG08_006935 [Glutinoglossum americanum]|uniref:Uncharacterized protein n=1 Tax=Glutinoglossum americanum TaxID=1670608 RepID=A0A9P8I0H7_9PEZI|nr:hypothetical protein FGG08_006935 [Glutinoglossum americanum]